MYLRYLILLLVLAAVPAQAQQPSAADKLILSALQMQQMGVELQKLAAEMQAALSRNAELERLCGDPCKPK